MLAYDVPVPTVPAATARSERKQGVPAGKLCCRGRLQGNHFNGPQEIELHGSVLSAGDALRGGMVASRTAAVGGSYSPRAGRQLWTSTLAKSLISGTRSKWHDSVRARAIRGVAAISEAPEDLRVVC
jgi:hypothetical protein